MSYESWRISFQDSEQAARAAYEAFQMNNDRANGLINQLEAIKEERDTLASHVERLRKAMMSASDKHISFAKRIALGKNDTAMQAVDKADALLVHEAYHVPVDASCLAKRDLSKRAEGKKMAALFIELKAHAYDEEHGTTDPSTGTREYPGDGAEYYNELMELADELHKQAEGLQ